MRNLEGDILSEVVENGMSSQGLMINETRGAKGEYLYESNHGPLTRHFLEFSDGKDCMSNPSATIYVWALALRRAAEIDSDLKLKSFSEHLIESLHLTVDRDRVITQDLASQKSMTIPVHENKYVTTDEFINHI